MAANKQSKGLTLKQKKQLVKYGMTASLAALVVTGFNRTRTSRKTHIYAGFALVGLAAYHSALYTKPPKKQLPQQKKPQIP